MICPSVWARWETAQTLSHGEWEAGDNMGGVAMWLCAGEGGHCGGAGMGWVRKSESGWDMFWK